MRPSSKPTHAYTPETIPVLQEALHLALADIQSKPGWVERLGEKATKEISARAITTAAMNGFQTVDELKAIAVRAVQVRFLSSEHAD